ncbi:hypothetical protein FKG96_12435 [Olivibacter sp. LS-1]|uniref:hypothetical protein n=1 Tax=Olivibacter sp. LS-1 TaxID=2592345 RepID=UPI0011EA7C8B|nr:hypothetical protein [Olivibacter sp. LS-1]QEL01580.1 hypothetical protein FKG96_12435 [Olivibacter sp. LS-1]
MSKWGNALVKDIKSRGWVEIEGVYYRPDSKEALSYNPPKKKKSKIIRTGRTDDTRNIRNKEKHADPFVQLVKQELGLDVWPEFYFSVERQYRIDYAIPTHKIAIEVDGGIWMKGNSGHSSGTGIKRDMEKSNLLQAMGWWLIRIEPSSLISTDSINHLKRIMNFPY